MEETLEMKFAVSDGKKGYDEIKKESYKYAKDTVKKGDSIDFLSFFCGVFALICMLIVLYFGTVGGFTNTMIYLMSVYVFIAFFCFCTPLQILISELLWNAGFKKRLAVNCGYEKELCLSEEEVKVTGKRGEECYSNYSECFFFETKNFIILNVTDRKLFPIVKDELSEEDLKELRQYCINENETFETEVEETEANETNSEAEVEDAGVNVANSETEVEEEEMDRADSEAEADGNEKENEDLEAGVEETKAESDESEADESEAEETDSTEQNAEAETAIENDESEKDSE